MTFREIEKLRGEKMGLNHPLANILGKSLKKASL